MIVLVIIQSRSGLSWYAFPLGKQSLYPAVCGLTPEFVLFYSFTNECR